MISFQISGFPRIEIQPLDEAMKGIAERMYRSVQQNFLEGGRPTKWIPRSTRLTSPYMPGRLLMGSGALYDSINRNSGDSWAEVWAGFGLPYARIHQTGGVTHPTVSPKARKFFWAMFFTTGDEGWKWLALTKKMNLTVSIPARPYMILQDEDWEYIVKALGQRRVRVSTTQGAELLPPR